MKTLFLMLIFLLSFFSFGQKIIIHVFERQEMVSYSNSVIDSVLEYPDVVMGINFDHIKYVIDLSHETSTYYVGDIRISDLPIKCQKFSNNLLKINILEEGFDYGLLINTDYDNEKVTWFWFDTFTTTVKVFKKFIIEKPS